MLFLYLINGDFQTNMCWFLMAGDLFDMLLPMLTIYQEYVRNHHYSLQVNSSDLGLMASFWGLFKFKTN